jgi:CBS domain-containing membrane protein
MDNNQNDISGEDLRAALREVKTYIDITEEDLKKIYEIALRHAKERLALKIPVKDVMTRTVIVIKEDSDINEAARVLSEGNVSGLPVVDNENSVIGVITEADILSAAGMGKEYAFKDVLRHILGKPLRKKKKGSKVKDMMTTPAITTKPEIDIREAAGILDEKQIKRLPVVDGENRLIGIISRADIVRAFNKK